MRIILGQDFLEIFPESKIGVVVAKNVQNSTEDNSKFEQLLNEAHEKAKLHLGESEFSKNKIVASWREAFKKFKTKKGNRSSIEALLKRVDNGRGIRSISPLVDIYNSISLEFGVPCGGEDIDKIFGDMKLTLATGNEEFITLGSEKSEPPLENELIYKDEKGAICRCWNWREAVRTMLTNETKNTVFVIENWNGEDLENFELALMTLKKRLEDYIGGDVQYEILDSNNTIVEFN